MNGIFLALIVSAVVAGALRGSMPAVTKAGIDGGKDAVTLAIGLIGQMALWLGFMRVLRDAGLMRSIARGLAPLMRRLFRDVPPEHPAMGAMILNLAANVLGLGNAATPFGLKAMVELQRLNPHPGVATNAMALFLSINTAGVAVLPLGAVAVRASMSAQDTAGIILPSILATSFGTLVAVLAAKLLERRPRYAPERYADASVPELESATLADGVPKAGEPEAELGPEPRPAGWRAALLAGALAAIAFGLARQLQSSLPESSGLDLAREVLSSWLLPLLMCTIVLFGFARRVRVYESFIKGAREGFDIGVMIIPFLVAILVAVGMLRASGMLDVLIALARPATDLAGFPAEALPMALVRPLSGSGALAVMIETMKAYGPDSFVGFLVCVINGSTETTFYVLALYFGSVHVRAARHTVAACLTADVAGIYAALVFSRIFF